jgi:hypothetical protein
MKMRFLLCGLAGLLVLLVSSCDAGAPADSEPPASVPISPSATTIYASWTTPAPSTTKISCGTTPGTYNIPAVDNGIQTNVRSHWAFISGLTASTTYHCQTGDGNQFTTKTLATPVSTPLVSVTFGTPVNPKPNQNNGDFYVNCVSNDHVTYLASDDISYGWGGVAFGANMSVNKLTRESPLTGANVNAMSNFGGSATCPFNGGKGSPKIIGMYCDMGNIYVTYSLLNYEGCSQFAQPYALAYGNILRSADHGASWSNFQAPNKFNSNGAVPNPDTASMFASNTGNSRLFSTASFVEYGTDNGQPLPACCRVDNADAYAYLIADDGIDPGRGGTDHLWLARVPRQSLPGLDAAAIEYYIGGADGSLDAAWSHSIGGIKPVLSYAVPYVNVPMVQYMPSTGRYILIISARITDAADITWLVYEAPHPWGAFTLINTTHAPPQGFYGLVPLQRSAAGATPNGTPLTLLMAGESGVAGGAWYQLWTLTMVANTH